jgi:hypothetical protein
MLYMRYIRIEIGSVSFTLSLCLVLYSKSFYYTPDADLLAGWLAIHPNGVKSAVSIFQPGLAWSFWAHAGVLVEGKLQ